MEVGQWTESAMDYLLGNENPSPANQQQIITTRLDLGSIEGEGGWITKLLAASGVVFPFLLFAFPWLHVFLSFSLRAHVGLHTIMPFANGQGEEARGRNWGW